MLVPVVDFFVAEAFFTDTRFVVAFLAAIYFAGTFATVAFLAAAFFTGAFALSVFTATFLPDTFLAAFLLAGFVALASAALLSLWPAIKNFVRSLTSLIHSGGRAQPLHVAPVLGLRYLAGSFALAAVFFLDLALDVVPAGRPRGFFVDE